MTIKETTEVYTRIYAKAIGIREDGTEFELRAGNWHGMNCSPMPAWSEYDEVPFTSIEEAKAYTTGLQTYGWRWKMKPNSVYFIERTKTTITKIEEHILEEETNG